MSIPDSLVSAAIFIREFTILCGKIFCILIKDFVRCVFPKKEKDLNGEIILITGSAHGMGRRLAIRCAEMGAKLVLWDINENVKDVAEEITQKNETASWYICDVTSEEDVNSKARLVQQEVGDVTILINNAGLMQNVPFFELDSKMIKKTLEVNTLAHFWTIRAFLPKMQEKNRGHIVAISSAAGLIGQVNQIDYAASKFGVVALMESLSYEMRQVNSEIRFTTICPLTVDTGMNQNPTARYPFLTPILSIEQAIEDILRSIRREEFLVTLPSHARFFFALAKVFPHEVTLEVLDFLAYCRVKNAEPVRTKETENPGKQSSKEIIISENMK